jgi:hypothetical protein
VTDALHHDPLAAVRAALERAGCDPHGPAHDFRARCPGHDGENLDGLHVSTGVDGRALAYCFVGCDAERIVGALGLAWADLFPPGHHHARAMPGIAKPVPVINLILRALSELGIGWTATRNPRVWLAESCPLCRRADSWPLFITEDERGRVALSCMGGCDQVAVLRALVEKETP